MLRNYARLQARTSLIANYDVDLLISQTLWIDLQNQSYVDWLLRLTGSTRHRSRDQRQGSKAPGLLILPAFISQDAFNMSATDIAGMVILAEKKEMQALWHKVIDRFDPTERGHNATQYGRWMTTNEPYEVHYEFRYEPWVISSRLSTKWYDYRFRGYGKNKIVHLEHMNASGFRFIVSPSSWLMHRPHSHTGTKLQHRDDFQDAQDQHKGLSYHTIFGHSTLLGNKISASIKEGSYKPKVDSASIACSHRLPWWERNHIRSRPNMKFKL